MYGNGRPRPTASGVRTGKIWRRKRSSQRRAAGRSVHVVDADDADAVLGQRRAQLGSTSSGVWRSLQLDDALAELVDAPATGVRPSTPRVGEAGVDLVVQAGDADHEELVEVRA